MAKPLVSHKGQVLLEFIILIGILFFIVMTAIYILYQDMQDYELAMQYQESYAFVHNLRETIQVARVMNIGFTQIIELLQTVRLQPYTLTLDSELLIFQQGDILHIIPLPGVTGSIDSSTLTIKRTTQGVVIS